MGCYATAIGTGGNGERAIAVREEHPIICDPDRLTIQAARNQYLTFWAQPNGAVLPPGDTALYRFTGQQVVRENFGTGDSQVASGPPGIRASRLLIRTLERISSSSSLRLPIDRFIVNDGCDGRS
jgi:hypothetical protein